MAPGPFTLATGVPPSYSNGSYLAGLRQEGSESGTRAGRPSIFVVENMTDGSSLVCVPSSSLEDDWNVGLVETIDLHP